MNLKTLSQIIFFSPNILYLRFDGDAIKTDETIRTLAQKWQPSKRPRSEERSTKAVDTDIIVVPCVVRLSLKWNAFHFVM